MTETQLSGQRSFEEVGAGYTFFSSGVPVGEPLEAGVGFAIKCSIVRKLEFLPKGINSRLMLLHLNLPHGRYATLISAYSPILPASDAFKEEFYEKLTNVIDSVPRRDKLFLLGDFNSRVGRDCTSWCKVIGPHGVGRKIPMGHCFSVLVLSTI